jgi:hypothetical protein
MSAKRVIKGVHVVPMGMANAVATRATPRPKLDEAAEAEFKAKVAALVAKYRRGCCNTLEDAQRVERLRR